TTNLYMSSGVLQSQDKIILGTSELFKRFNRTSLKKALSQPVDKITKALEDELDPGPARLEQSAIVLTVDIKQVPSIEQEGFMIKDPSTPSTNSSIRRKISPISKISSFKGLAGQILSQIKGLISY